MFARSMLLYLFNTFCRYTRSVQLVKNEAHCLGPVWNVFWINDIKRFQTAFFSLKNRIVRPTKIATFWPTKGNHCCVTPNDWYYCFNTLQQWCRRRGEGGASAPPKVWFGENPGKICENLRKILENLNKLPENTSKNGAQCALIWKNGAQNHMKTFCF